MTHGDPSLPSILNKHVKIFNGELGSIKYITAGVSNILPVVRFE
jgi:hypothetical protein